MLFRFGILCFATTLALGHASIHKRMSPEEVQQIFQTTHDAVPDYDVLQFEVSRLIKRGSRSVRSVRILSRKPFGGDMMLWIQPTEGILAGSNTPVFTAKINHVREEIEYLNYTDGLTNVGQLMEDPAMLASVMVKRSTRGRYTFDGYIVSKQLVVRSLPEALSEELTESRESKNKRSAYHVVYKKNSKKKLCPLRSLTPMTNERRKPRADANATREIPEIPRIIYPKIMLVADTTFHELNNNNIDRILAYLVTFWNGVDLLYRRFQEPMFRFNLARIIIAEEQQALPYLTESMITPYLYNVPRALEIATHYFYTLLSTFPETSYDAMFIMSRFQMSDGSPDCNILGLSYTGAACAVHHPMKRIFNVAAITDSGCFDGVFTAAHEFGHLMGAGHDESERCPASAGYVMTPTSDMTANSHDFSICSVEDFQTLLNENRVVCMYNKPNYTDNPLPRTLPGQMTDRDYQCDMVCEGRNCYDETKNHLPCTAIYCTDHTKNNTCVEEHEISPVDGAYCGKDKFCLHGQCIQSPKKKTTIKTPEAGPSNSERDRSRSPPKKNDQYNLQGKSDREKSPQGKSDREKSLHGKSSDGENQQRKNDGQQVKSNSRQNQQGEGNSGQKESANSNSGQNQQGKNYGRQNQQANSNNGRQNQQGNSNRGQNQQGTNNGRQNQQGNSNSGQNQQGKNNGRQNQQGNSNNVRQNQQGNTNSGQNQQGKNNARTNQQGNSNRNQNQPGKSNGRQNQRGNSNSGQTQQGKNNSGRDQQGKSNNGQNNRGKKSRSASIDIF